MLECTLKYEVGLSQLLCLKNAVKNKHSKMCIGRCECKRRWGTGKVSADKKRKEKLCHFVDISQFPSVFSISFQIKFFEKYPVLLGLIFPTIIDSWYSSIYMTAYFSFFFFSVFFFLPSLTFHLKCIFLKYFVFSINVVHFILVFGLKHLCCWAFFICFVYLMMYLYFPVCLHFVLYNKFILSWFYCFFNIYVETPVTFKIKKTNQTNRQKQQQQNTWGFNLDKNYLLWRYLLFWRLPEKETRNTRKSSFEF